MHLDLKLPFVIVFMSVALLASAQEEQEDIVTDRPDQTEAPELVPPGWIQIETGAIIENDAVDDQRFRNITYNTTLLRYAVSRRFELRFIQEVLRDEVNGKMLATGAGPLAIGTKISLTKELGILPQISLNSHLTYRTGFDFYKPAHVTPDFRFLFAHTLSDVFSLSYNLGAEWNGEDAVATGIYTLSLGASFIKNTGMFAEVYGFMPEGGPGDHRFDAGITYVFTPNLQIDVSGGIGLTSVAPDNFLSAGISWRFDPAAAHKKRMQE